MVASAWIACIFLCIEWFAARSAPTATVESWWRGMAYKHEAVGAEFKKALMQARVAKKMSQAQLA